MATKKEEVKTKYEVWLETQPDEVKELLKERFESLENTVKATREERDTFKGELKELAKKVTDDSEAGIQISELSKKLELSERKANFIVEAVKNGATRPTAAYAIATAENLYDDKGNPDWNRIKESVPELFKVTNTSNNAGSGTNKNALPNKNDFNNRVREAARQQNK
jgi:sugar-specific transcriptional regulator TrmB